MVSTGVKPLDDCIEKFNELKMKQTFRYIIYKIEGNNIIIDICGQREDTYEDFIKTIAKDSPRYAVFDYYFKSKEVPPREIKKLIFIFYCPDTASLKEKMLYASTKEDFKKKFVGIGKQIEAQDVSDFDANSIEKELLM
uniref:Actin depolyrising factor 2 n=1 Tax=Cryptocaryon irritans TaxID=153251 RepID=M9PA58_9CILI|nr:actin depolyrising factor 2 [Cryptocaryon irritans]